MARSEIERQKDAKRLVPSIGPSSIHGLRIGPYKLLQQIGEGGMGTVWMAEQQSPVQRRVAIKLIKSPAASKEIIARFEAERQALAMMDHQNIAKVLDAGTTDTGQPYFVMELVKGIPITQFCDDNELGINERLELFIPVCKAIQHAHQKGIIHRDLKPSNVLVTLYDGDAVPKVIDFGLAKAIDHTRKLTDKTLFTEFGKVVGTLQYISPEQAEMNALDVDARTDIYSLGVILYELLAGSTPLDEDTIRGNAVLQLLQMIREKEPPRPSHRLGDSADTITGISKQRQIAPARLHQLLKGELDWVVMKALEKDRRRRYETASDFAQDVRRYLNDETVRARPPSTGYQLRKFVRKNKGWVASITAMFLLLLGGVVGTSLGLIRANRKTADAMAQKKIAQKKTNEATQEKRRANQERALAIKNERRAVAAEEKAKRQAERFRASEAAARIQLAVARWNENRVADARQILEQIPKDFQNHLEWQFCRRWFLGSDMTLRGHNGMVASVRFSPDGRWIVSSSEDRNIRIWDARTGGQVNVWRAHDSKVVQVCFSPDGMWLASCSYDKTIKIWEASTGKLVLKIPIKRSQYGLSFSPDESC